MRIIAIGKKRIYTANQKGLGSGREIVVRSHDKQEGPTGDSAIVSRVQTVEAAIDAIMAEDPKAKLNEGELNQLKLQCRPHAQIWNPRAIVASGAAGRFELRPVEDIDTDLTDDSPQ